MKYRTLPVTLLMLSLTSIVQSAKLKRDPTGLMKRRMGSRDVNVSWTIVSRGEHGGHCRSTLRKWPAGGSRTLRSMWATGWTEVALMMPRKTITR